MLRKLRLSIQSRMYKKSFCSTGVDAISAINLRFFRFQRKLQQFADDSVIKNLSSIYPRFFCDYSSFHDFLLLEKRVILKVIYSKIVQNSFLNLSIVYLKNSPKKFNPNIFCSFHKQSVKKILENERKTVEALVQTKEIRISKVRLIEMIPLY